MRESVSDQHDFDERRRAHPPRALADQPEVDLRDGEGRRRLPDHELLRRVRRPGRRHADVQQLRAAPEPALRHGHHHHAGARARHDRARRTRPAARLLLLLGRRPRAPHRRRAGHARRRLRLRAGREHLDARLGRPHPPRRRGRGLLARGPRGRLDAVPPPARVERGHGSARRPREAHGRDRLAAARVLGGGRPADDPLVRGEPRAVDRPRRLALHRRPARDTLR